MFTTSAWDTAAATHLYRRAAFGANRQRIAWSVQAGMEASIEEIWGRSEHEAALFRGIRPLLALESIEPLQAWWMALILGDRAPLVERVALMWHNHFATSNDKVKDPRLMHRQIALFREQGLGDFRSLLHAVAQDPAMLLWLDGTSNKRGQANENFAREVMELFGLGIGNYSEEDIQEAARAFTGWAVQGRSAVFRDHDHDAGVKRIFATEGSFGVQEAIDLILAQPACARHIARRLLREFVLPEPDAAEIAQWASVLIEEDWNIDRTLKRLLRSELFYSQRARRARISGPVELIAITAITLGAKVAPQEAARKASEMGQSLMIPPSVKGWDGGQTWIHSGTWLARHNALMGLTLSPNSAHFDREEAFGAARSQAEVPRLLLATLLPDVHDSALQAVLDDAAGACSSVAEAVDRVAALILTSPEYHLT